MSFFYPVCLGEKCCLTVSCFAIYYDREWKHKCIILENKRWKKKIVWRLMEKQVQLDVLLWNLFNLLKLQSLIHLRLKLLLKWKELISAGFSEVDVLPPHQHTNLQEYKSLKIYHLHVKHEKISSHDDFIRLPVCPFQFRYWWF